MGPISDAHRRGAARCAILALCLGALLLTGCTSLSEWRRNGYKVGPNFHRPHAEVSPDWRDAEAEEVDAERLVEAAWWHEFHDPTLDRLMDEIRAQNLSLKAAALRVEKAQALRRVAAGNLYPQKQQAVGSYARRRLSENTQLGGFPALANFEDNWFTGFDAAWELDVWGRIRRGIEAADANVMRQTREYDALLVMLQAETAANYIQLRALDERLELAAQNIKIQEATIKIVKDQLELETVSPLDLHQANAELATTQSILPALAAGRRRAENRLCVLLGMPPQDLRQLLGEGRIPAPPETIAVGIPAMTLLQRPDVLAVKEGLAAQSARIGIATADLYPRIAITGTIGVESEQLTDLFEWASVAASVGPSFSWNILNYGRLLANIDAERAAFRELVFTYRETVLRADEEAENALNDFLQEKRRLGYLRTSADETLQAVELALLQYKHGLVDYQRVLDTQRGLVQLQDTLTESRGAAAVNLVSLYKALGGGWRARCMTPGPMDEFVVESTVIEEVEEAGPSMQSP